MAVRKRLGEMLLEAGVIDQNQLDAALGHQRKWGGRLGQALVDLKMTSEASVVEALSQKFGYEVVPLEAMEGGPVLEAAHIKPYGRGGEHRVDNGLLLRSDLHRLYDQGYVTVTADYVFKVGERLREEFRNGRSY